jgi:hypothetical protein
MDRFTSPSYIARSDPNAKPNEYSDSVVIATKEKSISNKNKTSISIIYSHVPAAEVFNNPELITAAKLARSEIKKQLLSTGGVSDILVAKVMDGMKYGSADTSRYGEISEKVLGSANFKHLLKPLDISESKFRFDSSVKLSEASGSKPRVKRATGIFQPAAIQTGQPSANHQKTATASSTRSPLIPEDNTESEESFMFSTFPSELKTDTASSNPTTKKTESNSNPSSTSWVTAKPTTTRPQPSVLSQPLPNSSSGVKKS